MSSLRQYRSNVSGLAKFAKKCGVESVNEGDLSFVTFLELDGSLVKGWGGYTKNKSFPHSAFSSENRRGCGSQMEYAGRTMRI
jgi:hypothetical protein